jgi:hypothetical protein
MDRHRRAIEHAATANFYEYLHGERTWHILLPHPATYNIEDEVVRLDRIMTALERYNGYHLDISTTGTTSFTQNEECMTTIALVLDYRTTALYVFQYETDHVNITIIISKHGAPIATRKLLDIRDIQNLDTHLPWDLLSR